MLNIDEALCLDVYIFRSIMYKSKVTVSRKNSQRQHERETLGVLTGDPKFL